MKLKFRAEPKDILIFIIFCVVLLYFVAIAVLNLNSFAQEGVLHGFNPIPAFGPDYIFATFVFFFFALAAIMTSVSSYFFDREKGFGIKAEAKKEKGYSRWATDKEMKKELKMVNPMAKKTDAAGLPLIMNEKEVWVDDGEYHNLIIGSTGAGKTQTTVLPMVHLLSKKGESMILTDPKGEIYEGTAEMLRARGYNIVLLNFRDPQQGNAWNPLSLPYNLYKSGNSDKANELLDDLAKNILYDESSKGQDPFWENTSADYFAGLALAMFDDATEEEINLNSINLMSTVGEEKFGGTTYIKEYFSYKDPAGAAYVNASSTLMAPTDTKGSILSVFKQKIKLFSSRENLSEMLSHSDFDMRDIGRNKTAVFIVIQDEKKTYHSLVTIFLKQCYETLISVAQECGGKLPFRTNFILDEFANMPPLKDVTTMVTAARSRNMRFNFIIQNFAQLYEVYGKENGETIKGNCGNIVYLISSELSALEEISKMCGEVKSKEKEKTSSTPLVTVSDLQRLKKWETIVLRLRQMPFKTKLTPNFEMNWGEEYPKAVYPQREKIPVKVFDVKAFVEKKKEEKINQMLNGATGGTGTGGMNMNMFGGGNPFGGAGMPTMNPFMGPSSKQVHGSSFAPAGFDVDALVKKIDAKIAELEEEEKREKEAQEKAVQETSVLPSLSSLSGVESSDTVHETESAEQGMIPFVLEPEVREDVSSVPVDNVIKQEVEFTTPVDNSLTDIPNKKIVDDIPVEKPAFVPKMDESFKIPVDNSLQPEEKNVTPVETVVSVPKMVETKVVPVEVNPKEEEASRPAGFVTDDQFFDDFFNDD